jgi:ABC-2 type transport system ATP-binding protein
MPVIDLRGVSLWRRTQEELAYDLKRIIIQSLEMRYRKPARRQVLNGIDLTVERGEKVGIVGPNGAGKSTLLKIICGILRPTTGQVTVTGRIAPLIELGAGFDNDLSVVENIIYYGVLLGFSRDEMRERIGPILAFAELEEYAKAPLKALSSGMNARLGFAIATDRRPEILVLDEILAVGDASFSRKSVQRMQEFWDAHSTILVVSHSLEFIASQCERAVWIDQGKIIAVGPAREIGEQYLESVYSEPSAEATDSPKFNFGLDLISSGGESRTISGITQIAAIPVAADDTVTIVGWALDLVRRTAAASVVFEIEGKPVGQAVPSDVRSDVSNWYRDLRLEKCGFSATLSMEGLAPGRHDVWMTVTATDAHGPYTVPFALTLDVAAAGQRAPVK